MCFQNASHQTKAYFTPRGPYLAPRCSTFSAPFSGMENAWGSVWSNVVFSSPPRSPPATWSPGVPIDNRVGAQRWPAGRAGLQGPPRSRPFQVCTGVGPGQRGPARGDSHRRCGSRAPGGSASQLQPPLQTPFFPPFPGAPQHCPAPLDTVLVCWGEPHLPQSVPIPCWPLSSCRAGSPLSH